MGCLPKVRPPAAAGADPEQGRACLPAPQVCSCPGLCLCHTEMVPSVGLKALWVALLKKWLLLFVTEKQWLSSTRVHHSDPLVWGCQGPGPPHLTRGTVLGGCPSLLLLHSGLLQLSQHQTGWHFHIIRLLTCVT